MEANELYNFSISPLVRTAFSLQWSEDNHVSLITQSGVHIFELVPRPTSGSATLNFSRAFVHPSEYLPSEVFSALVNKALWKMKKEEMYELLMREAITPKIEDKTSAKPRIIATAWSPLKLSESSGCLMVVLTSVGGIEISHKFGPDWFSVWNLTELWCKFVEKESKIVPGEATENSFRRISWPRHVERLVGTAVCWSPLFHDPEPFACIAAAFRSSELVIARIPGINVIARPGKPEIVYKTCLKNSARIDKLLWIVIENDKRHLVIVGYSDGKIHGLGLSEARGKFQENKLFVYEENSNRAKPSSLEFFKRENGNYEIFVTKSSCLLALSLGRTGECFNKRYLKLEGFSITGLTPLSAEELLLTTQDCRMYAVTTRENEDLRARLVSHRVKSTKVRYLGISRSPNAAILLNVTSPNGLYDHLVNREPSTLQVFSLSSKDRNAWRTISEKSKSGVPLNEYWDCLELVRIDAARNQEPAKILGKIPASPNGLGIEELRVAMLLGMIHRGLENKLASRSHERKVRESSEVEHLIFLLSACEHLARLSAKASPSPEEIRSAGILRLYMELYLAGEEEEEEEEEDAAVKEVQKKVAGHAKKKVIAAFRESRHMETIETESCDLCGEVLADLPWMVDSCPSGHKLPRCSLSLLQINTVDRRSCPICERLFHPSLDQLYEQVRCLYCDVPALRDTRLLMAHGLEHPDKLFKNLSKRPASYDQPENLKNDNQNEFGAVALGDKCTKRGIKRPQTFAVIVNKDENDDYSITETWQKF